MPAPSPPPDRDAIATSGMVAQRAPAPTISFGRRIADLARADPDRLAVTCGSHRMTRAELESSSNQLARKLATLKVTVGSMVTIALPNSVEFIVATAAAWKLGAIPQPVSAHLPERELQTMVDLADPVVVLGPESG